jgi:hypothetical protein
MRRLMMLIVACLLIGCSDQEALPPKMKVSQIEVVAISANREETTLLYMTDAEVISEIMAEFNQLQRTSFSDPEPPALIYKLIFKDSNNKKREYYYSDRPEYDGKIYTEKSAAKGIVWRATEKLATLLLGDQRRLLRTDE